MGWIPLPQRWQASIHQQNLEGNVMRNLAIGTAFVCFLIFFGATSALVTGIPMEPLNALLATLAAPLIGVGCALCVWRNPS